MPTLEDKLNEFNAQWQFTDMSWSKSSLWKLAQQANKMRSAMEYEGQKKRAQLLKNAGELTKARAAAHASEAARGAAIRSRAQLLSATGAMRSSAWGHAVRLKRKIVGGAMVLVFVYAAGRATPGALLRWGRSTSTGGDGGDGADGAGVTVHRGVHVPEAAKVALYRVKQEAETAMHAIVGSEKDSNDTDATGAMHGQHVVGGVVATATVLACIQCASNHK